MGNRSAGKTEIPLFSLEFSTPDREIPDVLGAQCRVGGAEGEEGLQQDIML